MSDSPEVKVVGKIPNIELYAYYGDDTEANRAAIARDIEQRRERIARKLENDQR